MDLAISSRSPRSSPRTSPASSEAWATASLRGSSLGSTARANAVSTPYPGVARTRDRPGSTRRRAIRGGSIPCTSTQPPYSEGATLSAWRPATTASARSAAPRISSLAREPASAASAASAPATAEAALPPIPPARGRPFSTRSASPPGAPSRRSTAPAAIAAVLRSGSVGMRGSEIETTTTPRPSTRRAATRSPLPVNASPRQSKPGPRFEVEPGAYATRSVTEQDAERRVLRVALDLHVPLHGCHPELDGLAFELGHRDLDLEDRGRRGPRSTGTCHPA